MSGMRSPLRGRFYQPIVPAFMRRVHCDLARRLFQMHGSRRRKLVRLNQQIPVGWNHFRTTMTQIFTRWNQMASWLSQLPWLQGAA
jgi:hypothetical protein